jgi:hypothetical protein
MKNCPNCNKKPEVGPVHGLLDPPVLLGYIVGCKKCGIFGPQRKTADRAMDEWDYAIKMGFIKRNDISP